MPSSSSSNAFARRVSRVSAFPPPPSAIRSDRMLGSRKPPRIMPPTRIACRDNGKPFFAYLRNRGIRQGPVEIIDFEHDVLTVDFEAAEVVLLMGIVGVTKVVEHRNRLDETLNSFLAESGNTGGDDGVAANQMLPEFVIGGAD